MAQKTYTWISLWFLITAPVMFWDAGYCLMRPRSMRGGDLHWLWKPYELYEQIDHVYGVKAFEDGEGFANAAALLNLAETLVNIAYLYKTHVSPSSIAPLVGYTGATMTVAKTVLYISQEVFCGGCAIGHNTLADMFAYWILPNMLWIIFPSLIMWKLGGDIFSSMRSTKSKTE